MTILADNKKTTIASSFKAQRKIPFLITLFLALALILPSNLSAVAQEDVAEVEFWQSVKDASDAQELKAYLNLYPQGKFAPLARLRIKKLSSAEKPIPPTSSAPAQPATPKVRVIAPIAAEAPVGTQSTAIPPVKAPTRTPEGTPTQALKKKPVLSEAPSAAPVTSNEQPPQQPANVPVQAPADTPPANTPPILQEVPPVASQPPSAKQQQQPTNVPVQAPVVTPPVNTPPVLREVPPTAPLPPSDQSPQQPISDPNQAPIEAPPPNTTPILRDVPTEAPLPPNNQPPQPPQPPVGAPPVLREVPTAEPVPPAPPSNLPVFRPDEVNLTDQMCQSRLGEYGYAELDFSGTSTVCLCREPFEISGTGTSCIPSAQIAPPPQPQPPGRLAEPRPPQRVISPRPRPVERVRRKPPKRQSKKRPPRAQARAIARGYCRRRYGGRLQKVVVKRSKFYCHYKLSKDDNYIAVKKKKFKDVSG